ncbi:biliverdin-producing heme oxygenase [Nocardioides fonticola]|uniref:Biliverdin-producing heme oxygenase n=1 Tax=Nocardioides fonticola TaxID=450363 RepID=A0ABP7XKI9_9ACTN
MTLAPSAPTSAPSLSAAMREGSMAEHAAAESSAFLVELLAGRVTEEGYATYLARLRAVYEALERVAAAQAGDPLVDAVRDPALERLARIDADLAVWSPGAAAPASPATARYVARIENAAAWGGLFLAHHYTRYLGDLSGGQAIGRILQRTYGRGEEGVAFYAFPAIAKLKPYKDDYRARLDAAGLDASQVGRVVAEVRVAFGLNQALFSELGTELPRYRRG